MAGRRRRDRSIQPDQWLGRNPRPPAAASVPRDGEDDQVLEKGPTGSRVTDGLEAEASAIVATQPETVEEDELFKQIDAQRRPLPTDLTPSGDGFAETASDRAAADIRAQLARISDWRGSMSQKEVGEAMGSPQSSVARFESGAADLRATTLARYAAACGYRLRIQLDPLDRAAVREESSTTVVLDAGQLELLASAQRVIDLLLGSRRESAHRQDPEQVVRLDTSR
jgi:transcriptional regulator with XRE-family HTH domain